LILRPIKFEIGINTAGGARLTN